MDRADARALLTLLTCTGDRPLPFARLERWMARQSLGWVHWIVIDDGECPTRCTQGQRYLRCEPGLDPSASFARNLHAGFEAIPNHPDPQFVFMIEDDDWYGPDYVASLFAALQSQDLVGEAPSRYYHVPERSYSWRPNSEHAALCATAFRAEFIPQIRTLIRTDDVYLDRRIWTQLDCRRDLRPTRHCVGLKGQPGRPGLGWGHDPCGFEPDPTGAVLHRWLGEDAAELLEATPARMPSRD